MDTVARIIEYEQGELDDDEIIELFSDLLNSGLVYSLQGHYHRQCRLLLAAGLIRRSANSD
jgi:hypothetical protein